MVSTTNCKFAGYCVYYKYNTGECYIKKEWPHPVYTKRILTPKISHKPNDWNLLEQKTYNINNGTAVKIEGYLTGQKVIEATDDGTWTNWNILDAKRTKLSNCNLTVEQITKPFLTQGETCWVRCDSPNKVQYKDFSVTEISPS
jgi:hypothetical protein